MKDNTVTITGFAAHVKERGIKELVMNVCVKFPCEATLLDEQCGSGRPLLKIGEKRLSQIFITLEA